MAGRTEFNTKTLATGAFSKSANALYFQIGANKGQAIDLTIGKMTATSLGIGTLASNITGALNKTGKGAGSKISGFLSNIDKAIS